MKKLTTILFVLFSTFTVSAQIQDPTTNSETLAPLHKSSSFGVAVGVSTSTNGLGGNVTAAWNDKLALRLGYEKLGMSFPNALVLEQNDFSFNVSPEFKTGGFSAIIDWYFLKSMYISAGAVLSELNLSAKIMSANPLKIGDIEYTPDEMGEINLTMGPQHKVAPYLGIGIGRNISRDHRFTMSFEVGAYHTGSYVVGLNGAELFEANNDESITKLNETLKGISWSGIYPVIKLGISYRIWKN